MKKFNVLGARTECILSMRIRLKIHGTVHHWKNRGNHCDFQQISMILPTFWTLPWYGNLLEICWKYGMEICWKYHGNLLEVKISMIWRDCTPSKKCDFEILP